MRRGLHEASNGPAEAGDHLVAAEGLELFCDGSRRAMDVEQELHLRDPLRKRMAALHRNLPALFVGELAFTSSRKSDRHRGVGHAERAGLPAFHLRLTKPPWEALVFKLLVHHRYYRNILHNASQGPQMPNIANEESPYLSR